jgi:hypothetical protein
MTIKILEFQGLGIVQFFKKSSLTLRFFHLMYGFDRLYIYILFFIGYISQTCSKNQFKEHILFYYIFQDDMPSIFQYLFTYFKMIKTKYALPKKSCTKPCYGVSVMFQLH